MYIYLNLLTNSLILVNTSSKHLIYLIYYKYYKIILYNNNNNNISLYFYNILLLKPIVLYIYYKILIKSKIYRIFSNKKKTLLFPHINFFHIIRIFIFFINIINFKKKLILFGLSNTFIKTIVVNLYFYKKINIFTYRGFKVSRSITYKKIGKVSKYF